MNGTKVTQFGIEYKLIRSRRKTLGIEIREDGLIVRAPYFASIADINRFLSQHRDWIIKKIEIMDERKREASSAEKLSAEQLNDLVKKAKEIIPKRVQFYAPKVGVTYGRITIRHQKTRWGSCSAKGNLNFNCLLMLTPDEVIDSVVVHELCHLKEMNHSKHFYEEVLRVYPEYKKWNKWLKQNGNRLIKSSVENTANENC